MILISYLFAKPKVRVGSPIKHPSPVGFRKRHKKHVSIDLETNPRDISSYSVFACLLAVTLATPQLTEYGNYNAIQRTVYTTVVTLIAIIVTAAVVDGIRSLYLYRVDDQLVQYLRSPAWHQKRLD